MDDARRNFESAVEIMRSLVDDYPGMIEYRRHLVWGSSSLSNLLFTVGQLQEAERLQRLALATAFSEPQESLKKTLEVGWNHYNLALLIHHQGYEEEAAEAFRDAFLGFERTLNETADDSNLHQHAQNALRWNLLTCPLIQFRDPERALAITKILLQSEPLSADYWQSLGIAHYRLRNWDEAVDALEKSRQLHVESPPSLLYFLTLAHQQNGNVDEARKWYEQVLEVREKIGRSTSPDDANLYLEVAERIEPGAS